MARAKASGSALVCFLACPGQLDEGCGVFGRGSKIGKRQALKLLIIKLLHRKVGDCVAVNSVCGHHEEHEITGSPTWL
jgi:hypothetical protein